jgi:ribosomal protein S6--L-glutamate ligase
MILSFHPCYEADVNIICAGRQPDQDDRSAMRAADAVILPQGCRQALYQMARANCAHVFPNYDARFAYPGKTGQTRLFQAAGMPHPQTWIFDDTMHFQRSGAAAAAAGFPVVFKLDWGGEGQTVFLLESPSDLAAALEKAAAFERSGQPGFILQAFVPDADRSLRVVVIGRRQTAYWRIQDNPTVFGTSVSAGARIDYRSAPDLRGKALALTAGLCRRFHINLAGFDFIFTESGCPSGERRPLFLEINYFFGRAGLGGSAPYYGMLQAEIDDWLAGLGLLTGRSSSPNKEGKQ